MDEAEALGFVVIGRNEGRRLATCLSSIPESHPRVYSDSGSTDDSVEIAQRAGFAIVPLSPAQPFTAARARNEGFSALMREHPDLRYVQFIDGDCELLSGWLDTALSALRERSDVAAVCGRRRERHPRASLYNALCDAEWDTPVGETLACGGDALFRAQPLTAVGGYDPRLIAGEEPELCFRLRRAGWKILRLPAEMTLHDAAMTRFRQWWKRAVRAGYAYAEGAAMHGRARPYHNVRAVMSIALWAAVLPAVATAALVAMPPYGALLFLAYPLQTVRIATKEHRRGRRFGLACCIGFLTVLGKLAEGAGALRYALNRLRGRSGTLIEYKSPEHEPRSQRG